jgi:hypothetical protein
MVKFLLSIKNQFPCIDITAQNNFAIKIACANDNIDVIKLILSLNHPQISNVQFINHLIDQNYKHNVTNILTKHLQCLTLIDV